MIYKSISWLMIFSLVLAGCAVKQAGIVSPQAAGAQDMLIRQIEYDRAGLPRFSHRLAERPSGTGDRFTVVRFLDGKPVMSFDVLVAGIESDFTKPFKVVYEWTGRGFLGGAEGTLVFADAAARSGSAHGGRDEAVATLAFVFAPMVVGAAGGFIIGIADGIKTTAEEVGKVVARKEEQVLTYTTYFYDSADRLVRTRMFKADDSRQELVSTLYDYQGDSRSPSRTTITTYPDGAVRIIEPAQSEGNH